MKSPLSPSEIHDINRILDANANRAAEGLRAVEEYLRFVREDPFLSREAKQLRHDLAVGLEGFDNLAFSRDAWGDVGRQTETREEYERNEIVDVVKANLKRLEQALRCLEEYGKLLAPQAARKFEELRYRAYTLERAILAADQAQNLMSDAQLYILIDGANSLAEFGEKARSLVEAEADLIQLRDKRLEDRDLLERARILRELTRGSATRMIINDRADLALLSDADGVHVGQEDMGLVDARRLLGPDRLVGVSTHSIEQARQAVVDGANYIGVGPTFASVTKQFDDFPGTQLLTKVAAEVRVPAFAIGGIGLAQVAAVLDTGIRRIAVSAAIWNSNDPRQEVSRFKHQLSLVERKP